MKQKCVRKLNPFTSTPVREALSNNGKISESCDFKSASRTFSASKTPLKTKQKIFKRKIKQNLTKGTFEENNIKK